ncbi:MAG: SDR family oxidoreductase [Rubrivivax sp.]|nr:MAG: SDR family oxidoreductase [Rubrivivax sp.]
MSQALQGRKVVVVGGGSGMGFATAQRVLELGGEVALVGRDPGKLASAQDRLTGGNALTAHVCDITREEQVEALFKAVGDFDHLVCTAADIRGAYALLPQLELEALERAVASKVTGPILLAKHAAPRLRPAGSITFVSGIAAYRPRPKGVAVAAINAALEGTVRALAVELAPIRVNAVSPGWVTTGIWNDVAGSQTDDLLAGMARQLPVGRVGRPEDIADALLFLLGNGYATGEILHVDGGHRLV